MRILLLLLALAASIGPARAESEPLTIFAAASLRGPLDEAIAAWPAPAATPRIVYAGTAALARQLREGAPADVFIAANAAWMDALDAGGLLAPGTRRNLVGNQLVLVSTDPVPEPAPPLAELIGNEKVAMALVNAVPAGIYGREALETLGEWERVRPHVVQVSNVRLALALASRGETGFAIVYTTDARLDPALHLARAFPPESHTPIVYPAAAMAGAADGAVPLLDWLSGPEAAAIFARYGFTPPAAP